MWYATLAQTKQEKIILDTDVSGDVAMAEILAHVTARIDKITLREFGPVKRTRRFDAAGSHISNTYNALNLGKQPILEVQTLSVGGVTLSAYDDDADTGDYFFLNDESPYFSIALSNVSQARWSDQINNEWRNAIRLTGIWGYRTQYPYEGWQPSAATVDDALNDSATTLTVSSVTPFSPGQRLRIGSEFLDVRAVDEEDGLTVTRAAGRTTAAAHSGGAAIDIWVPELPITRAALRWAAFLYERRGHFSSINFDAVIGQITAKYPPDAPEEVQNILKLYTAPDAEISSI